MAWSIVGVGTVAETTTTTLTLTEPAGVANGDLLIACIASRTTAVTPPTGTGWTQVHIQANNNTLTTTSAVASGVMFWQARAGTPTLAFTLPAGISVALGRIVAYRGVATATPLDVATSATTVTATTAVSVTGLTTTVADDLIVVMAAGGQEAAWSSFNATTPSGASGATDTTTAPSATWRERADSITTTGADTSLGIFDAVKTAAGATGNLTVTASLGAGHVIVAGAFKMLLPSTADAWNANDKSANITLSGSDKTATSSSATNAGVRSTTTRTNGTAGKYYAEFLIGATAPSRVGITPTSNTLIAAFSNCHAATSDGTLVVNSGTFGILIGALASTDVCCVAWDAGAELVWFRKNGGNWNNSGSANPATGTGGLDASFAASTAHALWAQGTVSGAVTTLRTELADYTQTVPSGFTSWMGETPSGGGVSVPVTGVAATGSVDAVTVATVASVSVPVTGVAATGAVDQVTAIGRMPASVPVTGVQATGAVDAVTVAGKANVSTTGVAATGSVGTVTVAAAAGVSVPVTGVEAVGAVGIVTVSTVTRVDVSVPVTGVAATGSVGTATATGKASTIVTGVSATGNVGSVTVTAGMGVTVLVTGVAATGAVDSVSVVGKASVPLTGVAAVGAVGGVSVVAGGSISTTVTGVAATGSVGSVTVTAAELAGLVSVWNGSAWVDKPAKVWDGAVWAQKPVKHWSGSAWV